MTSGPKRKSIEDRFWTKVEKHGPDECWGWIASTTTFGYGRIGRGGQDGRMESAHRISWEIHFGPVPDDLLVLHKCDNPPCTNPNHLFLGTHDDNMADAWGKGRRIFNPRMPGASHPSATITPEIASAIRSAYSDIPNTKELAVKFGVSHGTVGSVLAGQHWSVKGEPSLCSKRGTRRRWHKRP